MYANRIIPVYYNIKQTDNRNHLETMPSSHHILVVILRQVIKPLFHRASSGEVPQGRSNGSTFTFCTNSLMRLNISGQRTHVLLYTMNHVDKKND